MSMTRCVHRAGGPRALGRAFRYARCVCAALLMVSAVTATAMAQTQPESEDVEPRVIGRPGTMLIGISGFVDKFASSENLFPMNYTAQVDVCRFLTKRFAVRVGTVGTGSVGGEEADEVVSAGSGAPSV